MHSSLSAAIRRACVVILAMAAAQIAAPIATITAAVAHEVRPAVVTASFEQPQRFVVTVSTNLEALLAGIGPEHKDTDHAPTSSQYNLLRALPPAELRSRFEAYLPRWLEGVRTEFDGIRVTPAAMAIEIPEVGEPAQSRISVVRLSGTVPPGAKTFSWQYSAGFGSSVLRVKQAGTDEMVTSWLKDGASSEAVPLSGAAPKSRLRLFVEYVQLGFVHIVPEGLDHILFVLGLFFLSTQLRPLLVQVTAFTLAHSITLALGLYGVVRLSPAIVEPLIALSIVYVAAENIMTSKLSPWRPFVVFGFGLLHGLGFAGILQELALPRDSYVTGLVGFNIGVELGQLTVIAIAYLATAMWFGRETWYRSRIVVPASAAIALAGLFWTIQRTLFS